MPSPLEATWVSLPKPLSAQGITGIRAPGLPLQVPAYLAVDASLNRHLMVGIPDGTDPVTAHEMRGLRVVTDRLQVGQNPEALYIDIGCSDKSQFPTFNAVLEDLLRSLASSTTPVRDSVATALSRWRAFWTAKRRGLSREEALGLFGELWFLDRWMEPVDGSKVSRWMGSQGARHDFQWELASVEAKTAAGAGSGRPVHHIGSLDQLGDPDTGELFLFSLHVVDDVLAANTLPGLVDDMERQLAGDSEAISLFRSKLADYGYSPVDADKYQRRLRVVSESLYAVRDGFPRLTRDSFAGGLPGGVGEVRYMLDMAACEGWRIATSPSEPRAVFLR